MLHSGTAARTVLIAATTSIITAEAGQQQEPDQRITGYTGSVVVVAEEQKQNKQPGQVGTAEIVEHVSFLRS